MQEFQALVGLVKSGMRQEGNRLKVRTKLAKLIFGDRCQNAIEDNPPGGVGALDRLVELYRLISHGTSSKLDSSSWKKVRWVLGGLPRWDYSDIRCAVVATICWSL